MIQAIGLTSMPRRNGPPAVDDLTFEVRPGQVTGLLGAPGAGKSTTLRLMLELEAGRGVTLFDGSPLHRVPYPSREVGVLLGDVPGHPGRAARSHLRMLTAALGVPAARADEVLDVVGLTGLADQRLSTYSLGMYRRLGIGAALLADPRTLFLDEPSFGLSPREAAWVHALLRAYAADGGAVLVTGRDAKAMARTADRVVTIDGGRLVADQSAEEFTRTRLRPHVAVHSPHAQRLAGVLTEGGTEIAEAAGSRLVIYGTTSAHIGEIAYRNGILLHRLADEVADLGPVAPLCRADGREPAAAPTAPAAASAAPPAPRSPARARRAVQPATPAQALRYELHRLGGVRTPWWIAAVSLLASVAGALVLARTGESSALSMMSGWVDRLPLPPAAMGAGLLGALAYGQEFRYPALAPAQVPVPRRLRLLAAKLVVSGVIALLLAAAAAVFDTAVLRVVLDPGQVPLPTDRPAQAAGWAGLAVGCAWAGLLAAGVFRTTALGMAAVLTIPLLVAPAVGMFVHSREGGRLIDAAGALGSVVGGWPGGAGSTAAGVAAVAVQPVGCAFVLSLAVLLCAHLATVLRGRSR
ncbi:ATP-binding cassette domain-containing protein [Streptomyces sp. H10-C2]|uniref:ABC transporter ATP-binding protein n=1 Tax=unclassified Streptomyces TaxID=2593676 RepID=UPI0024B9347D|nr:MULTISPECIES: ATP-binding cassette domain-containing protein [unclassified Streptomyces]MDJ0341575.1 ATP-binding cassette domain-containing protein [Streptomyces sp. PH10-H1]MDJ0371323.1 ATP-binding cassette domain-containing protein [Streptomyces sp. H10-C2]